MRTPIILTADNDPSVLEGLEQDLHKRYQGDYLLVKTTSGEEALGALKAYKQQNEPVALILADQRMAGMGGVRLLVAAKNLYPDAGRILLTTYGDTEEAILSINEVGINHFLIKPWQPAEDKLYPIVDELLADWMMSVRLPYLQVRGIMNSHVARIRDSASLHHAAEIVALSGIGDLMVVDEDGSFLGVLSEGDILRNALPDFDEIVEEGGTLYDAFQLFIRKGRELSDRPITPLVIRNALTLHPTDHVAKAAKVLIDRQIRLLPVIEDGRLVGTVSRANICQAVVGKL